MYPHPIKLKQNERIIVKEIYDGNENWPNWIYCSKRDGSNAGWVPEQIIKHEKNGEIILQNYTAKELNVKEREILQGLKVLNGWIWGKNIDTNEQGWIPLENLKEIIDN